jgi:ketosteroid isomerase-like protein
MSELDPKSEVMAAHRRYAKALSANNVIELRSLRHPDFIFTSSRGRRFPSEEELAAMASGNSHVEYLELHELDARVIGDTAVVTAGMRLAGIWNGASYSGEFALTATWTRSPSGWLIVAVHSSAIQ